MTTPRTRLRPARPPRGSRKLGAARRFLESPRGLSLVELLVALALGLMLVAAVATLLLSHLAEHRRLLAEVRLMQDLRAMADLITRDLRRAGHWAGADASVATGASAPQPNPHAGWSVDAAALGYSYSRHAQDDALVLNNERHGFRLNARTHVLQMRMAGAALAPSNSDTWQPLNDPEQVHITRLAITRSSSDLSLLAHCAKTTCASSTNCPPLQQVSVLVVELRAADAHDPSLVRELRTRVRARNDLVTGECPA